MEESVNKSIVTRDNIFENMHILDNEGNKGVVIECKDLHNVYVAFGIEGAGMDWNEINSESGGGGFFCFVDGCSGNSEKTAPLYFIKK